MKIRYRKISPNEEGYILDFLDRSIPLTIEELEELMEWKAK